MVTDEEARKKTCGSFFSHLGRNPGAWWLSSTRLKEAADALRDRSWPKEKTHQDVKAATADLRVGPVYMLLMGMAIEAGLKAIMVAQKPEYIEEDRISKKFATHRLRDLWSKAGLHKYRQDDPLLHRLESFIVTFGRYPVSTTKGGMDTMKRSSFHAEPHFDMVTRLWARLEKRVSKVL